MRSIEFYFAPDPLATYLTQGVDPKVTIFGVPFDATSTYRTGSRFGPNAIREAFMNIEIYSKNLGVNLEVGSIEDLGNLGRIGKTEAMNKAVESVTREVLRRGKVPAILGGEHSITNGSFRAFEDCALVVFDAHFDLRDEFEGLRLSHATFLRRLVDDNRVKRLIHIGARAATKAEWDFVRDRGILAIDSEKSYDIEEAVRTLQEAIKGLDKIYVSIDLDVVDPAFAPGVGNPEANGLTSREMLSFIYALRGKDIAGFDIVELCPAYDNGATSVLAARLLAELACLVEARRKG